MKNKYSILYNDTLIAKIAADRIEIERHPSHPDWMLVAFYKDGSLAHHSAVFIDENMVVEKDGTNEQITFQEKANKASDETTLSEPSE